MNLPSMISKPAGVCIQLLAARIQNAEKSVPTATMIAEARCIHCGTSLRPKSSTPRKAASRKNAVSASYPISGAMIAAVASE
jgi:hypothetical protein